MKTLAELKVQNLPHATMASVGLVFGPTAPEDRDDIKVKLDEYFRAFVTPSESGECIKCNSILTGLLGSFIWGVVHGEGHCAECHYPARAHHDLPIGGRLTHLVLQYHPDVLEERQDERQDEQQGED